MRTPGKELKRIVRRHFDWRDRFCLTKREFDTKIEKMLADAGRFGYGELALSLIPDLEARWDRIPDELNKKELMKVRR